MLSLNKVQIIGRVGRDPETKTFPNGGQIVNFSVAVSDGYKDKATGEWKENTTWFNVAVRNEVKGNYVTRSVKKGSIVYVEGKIRERSFKDKDGNDRKSWDLDVPPFGGDVLVHTDKSDGEGAKGDRPSVNKPYKAKESVADDIDDVIPF